MPRGRDNWKRLQDALAHVNFWSLPLISRPRGLCLDSYEMIVKGRRRRFHGIEAAEPGPEEAMGGSADPHSIAPASPARTCSASRTSAVEPTPLASPRPLPTPPSARPRQCPRADPVVGPVVTS